MAETCYARAGDGHIAYQLTGRGDKTLLMRSYGTISVDAFDREIHMARAIKRLSTFARILTFDRLGIGLSDPLPSGQGPTIEQEVSDAVAVLDDAGVDEVSVYASFTSGPWGIMLAATHPERVGSLILCNTFSCARRKEDHPLGFPPSIVETMESQLEPGVVEQRFDVAASFAPTLKDDQGFRTWWEEDGRRGASPATADRIRSLIWDTDVRHVLPTLSIPTLVVHTSGSQWFRVAHGRHLAEHIPGARYVELEGVDQFEFAADAEELLDEIEEFLTGTRSGHSRDRVLATILFTDIVDSSGQAAALGDKRWSEVLDTHDAMVRRQVQRFGGTEVATTGDGFLITFSGPAKAVGCATSIRDGASQLGIEVRSGVHTGEVEMRGKDVSGIAVHIARRVCDAAEGGTILVSGAVPTLAIGSGLEFADRGVHELKGIPGAWQLLEASPQ